ncbi:Nuclear transcription factor Y subunit B-7 [Orobanche gracilis]
MKRDRDNIEDEENPPTCPNRTTFRITPKSTCSNHNVQNHDGARGEMISSSNNISSSSNNISNNNNNKEQDRFLPIANVGRIMKKVIPGNGKISKDAKETVQECVSEFISFVTGEASEKCQREKRKTINGDDILWAIMTLGFEDYVNPLKLYLGKYREIEGEKLNIPKQQRVEQRLQHENQTFNQVPFNSIYSSTNLISQPPFMPTDPPPFPSHFSQNSMQATLPQQDHTDEHW